MFYTPSHGQIAGNLYLQSLRTVNARFVPGKRGNTLFCQSPPKQAVVTIGVIGQSAIVVNKDSDRKGGQACFFVEAATSLSHIADAHEGDIGCPLHPHHLFAMSA